MRTVFLYLISCILPAVVFSQNTAMTGPAVQPKFVTTEQVLQDLQQNRMASKYYETSKDLVYLDERIISALNGISPGEVTQENLDYIKYINARDQKPFREVWDHNVFLVYSSPRTDIRQRLTDTAALSDLKRKLGREFNRIDQVAFINGNDRIMFIMRHPNSEAGSFYRAILNNGKIRIDEVASWLDS